MQAQHHQRTRLLIYSQRPVDQTFALESQASPASAFFSVPIIHVSQVVLTFDVRMDAKPQCAVDRGYS